MIYVGKSFSSKLCVTSESVFRILRYGIIKSIVFGIRWKLKSLNSYGLRVIEKGN